MKRITLKLAIASVAIGLWATPTEAQTLQQRQQMYIQAQRMGMWNRIRMFSQPQFQLVTDPRGANFGFTQQILWGPSMRSVFSPWGQTTIFRSNASSVFAWNPSMGPVSRINMPAMFGFTVNANGQMRQFSRPAISVMSNLNGSTSFFNPNTPTFLSGNFNLSVPLNGTVPVAMPISTASLSSGATISARNRTANASTAMNSTLNRTRAAATMSTPNSQPRRFMTIQEGLAQGYTLDQILHTPLSQQFGVKSTANGTPRRFMTIQEGLAQGYTLDQILHTPLSQQFGVKAAPRGGLTNAAWWGPRGTQVPAGNFTEDTLPLIRRQAAAYNGYIPANQIMR